MPKTFNTDKAPQTIGPYAQATISGGLLFTSGQLGLEPKSGALPEGIEAQTKAALDNMQAILEGAGSDLTRVLKTTIFLVDMNDFAKVNAVYGEYFNAHKPARSCVQVARLPKDGLVEIEAVAELK